jgi:choline dehydrogenase-like flavoprotein
MSPDDFTEGKAIDDRFVWPITYDDLRPFYESVESTMRVTVGDPIDGIPPNAASFRTAPVGDWVPFLETARSFGCGIGTLPMAKGAPWLVSMRSTGFNSYHCIVKPLARFESLRLLRGAVATRIVPSRRVGDAATVEFFDLTTRERREIKCRAVVVAAGAIDSTKLLLQSGTNDSPGGLGNSAGLVGRYLHDHLRQWWPARLERPMPVLRHPLYIAREAVGEKDPLMASSLTLGRGDPRTLTRINAWRGAASDLIGVQVFGTVVPSPESRVRLSEQRASDPTRDIVEIDIRYSEASIRNMIEARDRFSEIFTRSGLRAVPEGPFHDMWPGSSYHYGGTVRMHADPAHGVLDEWNRVREAPEVIVCDASCFTTGPEKNPTLTAMAIAARAARHLASELRAG